MKINYWQNFEEGCYYHIYNHSVSNQNIFVSEKDYVDFLSKHFKYLSCAFETMAYCLMPNHFHFLIKVKPQEIILENAKREISKASASFQRREADLNVFILDQYRRYFSSFSLAFNARNNHRGQLFLKRFKRISIDPDDKLIYMICYIHHNPIHHRHTKDYTSWKYSSFKQYNLNEIGTHIDNIIEKYFGGIENFNKFHNSFRLSQGEELNLE